MKWNVSQAHETIANEQTNTHLDQAAKKVPEGDANTEDRTQHLSRVKGAS